MEGFRGPFGLPSPGTPLTVPVKLVYSAYAVAPQDQLINCDASQGAFPVYLPNAAGCLGKIIEITKRDSSTNAITITPTTNDTVGGASSRVLSYESATTKLQSDGKSNWFVVTGGMNYVSTSSSGVSGTTSTTFVNATNLSATIITSGKPVLVGIVPDSSANFAHYEGASGETELVRIQRDSSTTVFNVQTSAGTNFTPIGQMTIDFPAAGSHTYTVQQRSLGGGIVQLDYAILVLYELGT